MMTVFTPSHHSTLFYSTYFPVHIASLLFRSTIFIMFILIYLIVSYSVRACCLTAILSAPSILRVSNVSSMFISSLSSRLLLFCSSKMTLFCRLYSLLYFVCLIHPFYSVHSHVCHSALFCTYFLNVICLWELE